METREFNVGEEVIYKGRRGKIITHHPGNDDHDQMWIPDHYVVELNNGTIIQCLVNDLKGNTLLQTNLPLR